MQYVLTVSSPSSSALPLPLPLHLHHKSSRQKVTSHPQPGHRMHHIAPHHTPLVQGRSSTTNEPSAPCLAQLLKTATSRASLFPSSLPPLQHQHRILLHLDFSSSHSGTWHQSPISGPAPRQALLWLDGFDGLWSTASAHFPRRHNDPFLLLRLHKPSAAVVPLFPFPLRLSPLACQALLLTRTRTSNTDTTTCFGWHRWRSPREAESVALRSPSSPRQVLRC
ncbi:hypothetical protein J3F84DRAFT_354947 [Trichoderma pleuroticola]